jgi:hypothetical protein
VTERQRQISESLRQPMETGRVTIARANAHATDLRVLAKWLVPLNAPRRLEHPPHQSG